MLTDNHFVSNPSFKKDFAFIRQLETQNNAYQEKIWEKFVGGYNKNDNDIRIINTRFGSHPSGLSSESEDSVHIVQGDWDYEPTFNLANTSLEQKSLKDRSKSVSGSKIVLNETERKKLRKKLTRHLENGTLEKFEIGKIGDHTSRNSRKELKERSYSAKEDHQKVYFDKWRITNSTLNASKSESDASLREEKPELGDEPAIEIEKKMSEEIERLKAQLNMRTKKVKRIKPKMSERRIKSQEHRKHIQVTGEADYPTEMRKSRHFIEKCIGVLKDLSIAIDNGISPPDGDDDYNRRKVRTKEFTSRFSRIYLYPLLTQLSQLNTTEKFSAIYTRFTSLYQLTYQALQASFNHLPNSVGNAFFQKLIQCLKYALDICERNEKFHNDDVQDNADYIRIFKNHCTDLSHKIEVGFPTKSGGSLLNSKSTRTSLMPGQQGIKNSVQNRDHSKDVQNRYSMYSSSLALKRDKQWRKMLAAFEGKKPKVKSRYRTATFKHRPPVEKVSSKVLFQPKQHRLDDKRSSLVLLSNTPVDGPINEDNIQTMIQYENAKIGTTKNGKEDFVEEEKYVEEDVNNGTIFIENQNQYTCEKTEQQDDILTKLLHLVQDNEDKRPGDTDINLTNTIMVLQRCLSLKNQSTDIRKAEADGVQQFTIQNNRMEISPELIGKKTKKEHKITVSGTKNAQLICIKDENSIASIEEEEEESENRSLDLQRKKLKTAEVQTCDFEQVMESPALNKSKSSIKISRVKKSRRVLELLPKTYAINIIQYKLMFYKHHKGNHMYKKTVDSKPWEVMDRISEELLDYALLGIAKEIEVNEVLENLYNAEFQY